MADKEQGDSKAAFTFPTWLDAAFIQQALNRDTQTSKVTELSVSPATAPGNNYGSVIYRVKASLADGQEKHLIVKALPPGDVGKFLKEGGYFDVEMAMFGRIVPKMEALLNATVPGLYPPLTARCLHHDTTPTDFLVLEDLRAQGFKMVDRHKGLGLRHSLVAIRALARFHGASAALLERDPTAANRLVNPGKQGNDGFEAFVVSGIQGTADSCRKWEGFEEIADCLDAMKPDYMRKFGDLREPKTDTFNVIIHGDFWMSNMMFRYEDGEPVDVKLLDLQVSHRAPAAVEVLHFLSFNPTEDVAKNHYDLLVREYHKALVETMGNLGLHAPSLEKMLADMNSHGAYVLFGTLTCLPMTKARKAIDMNALLARDPNALTVLYENPSVKLWLQRVLPDFKSKGWLSS